MVTAAPLLVVVVVVVFVVVFAGKIVKKSVFTMHCTENQIYVFTEQELHGLSPNSYIHVSVINLYIPKDWSTNRQTDPGNILISYRYMSVGIGRQNITYNSVLEIMTMRSFISGKT
jgi:hypothetical protein